MLLVAGFTGIAYGAALLNPQGLTAGYTLVALTGASYFVARSALLSVTGARVRRTITPRAVLEGGETRVHLLVEAGPAAGRVRIEERVGNKRTWLEARRGARGIEAEYSIQVPYGRLRIRGPRLEVSDPLGVFTGSVDLSREDTVLGLPRIEERLAVEIAAAAALQAGSLSGRPGAGVAYLYSRDYTPDDDARLIDWKGYARRAKPLVKVFEVERLTTTLLVLDYTPGMRYTAEAARLLATIAYTALTLGARVKTATISDSLYTSPWLEKRHQVATAQAILAQVEEGKSMPCNKHIEALEKLLSRIPHPPATIIIATEACNPQAYSKILDAQATKSRVYILTLNKKLRTTLAETIPALNAKALSNHLTRL